jgi:hypothetical protein
MPRPVTAVRTLLRVTAAMSRLRRILRASALALLGL